MSQLSPTLRSFTGGQVGFWCPGCEETHIIPVESANAGANWGYNGNPEKPTFTPSILVRGGHYAPGWQGPDCYCNFEERFGKPSDFKCRQCHSYVTDGHIQFLADCSHALAGQTVDIPEFPK